MRKIQIILFLIVAVSYGQKKAIDKSHKSFIITDTKNDTLKDAYYYNIKTKTYSYTAKNGHFFYKSENLNDTILISKLGYKILKTKIKDIKGIITLKRDDKTQLSPIKITVNKKKDLDSFYYKQKKRFQLKISTYSAIFVSEFKNKKLKKLKEIKFYIKNSSNNNSSSKLQPIILDNELNLIYTSKNSIQIPQNHSEWICVKFTKPFRLQKNKKYYIGLKLVNNKKINEIELGMLSRKKTITMLQSNLDNSFNVTCKNKFGCTINFKLFFLK